PAISGRARAGRDPASVGKASAEIALAHSRIRSRFGNHLREMFGARTQCALSLSWEFGRGPRALARGPTNQDSPRVTLNARLAMVTAQSGVRRNSRAVFVVGSRFYLASQGARLEAANFHRYKKAFAVARTG